MEIEETSLGKQPAFFTTQPIPTSRKGLRLHDDEMWCARKFFMENLEINSGNEVPADRHRTDSS